MTEKVDEFELSTEEYLGFMIDNFQYMKKAWNGEKFSWLPTDRFRLAFMVAGTLDEEPETIRQAIKTEFPDFIEDCKEQIQDKSRMLREFDWIPKELP